jgi:hypothetical protein
MPGIPEPIEHTAIADLVSTYGKTWHTWQIDRDASLPVGIPQLMMGFTADGQLKPEMIASRDRAFDIRTADVKKARADLAQAAGQPDPGADAWKDGSVSQLTLEEVPVKNRA